MKTAYQRILLLLLAGILLITLENCCYYDCCDCDYNVREWGLKPEYSTDLNDIVKLEDARPLRNPAKIYSYKHYILVNEPQQGMHIIDNSDPRNPEPIQFLKIAGSNDVAIKNDVIYADQFDNLIIIALDSLTDVMEKKLLPDVFENYGYYDVVPEEKDVYYECPDPSYGVVVNWVADSVDYPCYNY
ncbi:MAG: hypothetical protein ABJG41_01680 [Cyclobacteriaceae bacterium]